ncbi:class F sortase [Nocardioides currus]|uniref:class F sortase n=1 Tax=Nocardioides currus TaxID=2133958 RepID=UPI001403FA28|nr:class F sortase [Nocardioides currus]
MLGIAVAGVGPLPGGAAATDQPSPEPADVVVTAATAPRTGAVAPEPPVSAELPSGTVVPVVPVGTTADGTLDVPDDIRVSGWWRGGSRLGDPFGSMLIAAHVDSARQGLGPYAELLTVSAGARFALTSSSLSQDYEVESLRLIPKGTVATHRWITSPTGPHRMTLVTCAGPYVESKGGYQRLAVVTATPVGQPEPRSER